MKTQNNCGPKCNCGTNGGSQSSFSGDVQSGVTSSVLSAILLFAFTAITGIKLS